MPRPLRLLVDGAGSPILLLFACAAADDITTGNERDLTLER